MFSLQSLQRSSVRLQEFGDSIGLGDGEADDERWGTAGKVFWCLRPAVLVGSWVSYLSTEAKMGSMRPVQVLNGTLD